MSEGLDGVVGRPHHAPPSGADLPSIHASATDASKEPELFPEPRATPNALGVRPSRETASAGADFSGATMAMAASVDPQAANGPAAGASPQNHTSPGGPPPWDGRAWGGGPPPINPPSTPFWRGDRLIDPTVTDGDRAIVVIMHLWWVLFFAGLGFFAILIPVVLWAVRQSSSAFVDDHGREALNVQLTGLILCISIFGLLVVPFWGIFCAINSIRAAIAAGSREHFRYGAILRPLG